MNIITACDEHREITTELEFDERGFYFCPQCGKYRWPALHGETKYEPTLIDPRVVELNRIKLERSKK